ncbi:MAG TPA: stage III sporulation protein AG [Lachnospiraceae bacterium]|nr:stage III sporulation protein AG [Lachnospiraceae bacterium]
MHLKWIQDLKEGKLKKDQLLILFLSGILLLVIALPVSKEGTEEDRQTQTIKIEENGRKEAYEAELENKLEQVLSKVEGVGKVEVMIYFASSSEKIVEKDEQTTVYEHLENGEEIPYVVKEISAVPDGIVVVAEGGGNTVVRKEIQEAVQALFAVEAHKIKIMKMSHESS